MPRRPTLLPRLLTVLVVLAGVLLGGAATSAAAGTPWGDVSHFGELPAELNAPQAAFGVNPEDGSVWIVDTVGTEPEELRLQKFEKVGGVWKAVASHLLGLNETAREAVKEVEGVAFDTKEKRAYVLVTEARLRGKNEEEQVASELWAFSTETTGTNIAPAPETKEGVLVPRTESSLSGSPVGKKEFSPNSGGKRHDAVRAGRDHGQPRQRPGADHRVDREPRTRKTAGVGGLRQRRNQDGLGRQEQVLQRMRLSHVARRGLRENPRTRRQPRRNHRTPGGPLLRTDTETGLLAPARKGMHRTDHQQRTAVPVRRKGRRDRKRQRSRRGDVGRQGRQRLRARRGPERR